MNWLEFVEPVLVKLYEETLRANGYNSTAGAILASLTISRLKVGMQELHNVASPADGGSFGLRLASEVKKSIPLNPETKDIVRAIDATIHKMASEALVEHFAGITGCREAGEN